MPKGVPNKRYTGEFKQMVVESMMRDKISYTTFFQIYENCIFTREQALDLLVRMGEHNSAESYKYIKKKYRLVTYTKDDVVSAVSEIMRARNAFFFGEENPH